MRKVFYLSTCTTCKRIIDELGTLLDDFQMQDIKQTPISENEVDWIFSKLGSYEAFFSKRAMKYKSLGLKEKITQDSQYREYLLMDYTFLKRPVFIIDEHVVAGNSKKEIEKLKSLLS